MTTHIKIVKVKWRMIAKHYGLKKKVRELLATISEKHCLDEEDTRWFFITQLLQGDWYFDHLHIDIVPGIDSKLHDENSSGDGLYYFEPDETTQLLRFLGVAKITRAIDVIHIRFDNGDVFSNMRDEAIQ